MKLSQDDKILSIIMEQRGKLTPRQIWYRYGIKYGLTEYTKRPYIQVTSVRRSLNSLMKAGRIMECGKTDYHCLIDNFKTTETLYSIMTKEVKQLELSLC
jgi:hypothetical protein